MDHSEDSHIDKKQKVEMSQEQEKEQLFTTVGEQAQEVDNEVRQTGAFDAQGHPVQEIESLCMNCHENGVTRMLLTKIPYFREIILMSFECPHCHFKNSEIQPAAQIAEKGSRYVFKVENKQDFNRQIVKSETATVRFTELDIEIPPKKGQLINVEGILQEMIEDLESDQPERQKVQPEIYEKINQVIAKIKSFIEAEPNTLPLTVTIDDPAGNSWVEYVPGSEEHKWSMYEYNRTAEQNVFLGLVSADEVAQHKLKESQEKKQATETNVSSTLSNAPHTTGFISDASEIENFANEVQTFAATCSSCYKPCETHMKTVNIPHFKDVILMSTVCDHCGYKSNEVKTGGAIPDKGKRTTLKVTDPEDLARDILKSETCGMNIPELNLDLTPGTLGGRFTTIEGLLTQVMEELHGRVFTQSSDSMDEETKARWTSFFARLEDAVSGKIPFTIIMEDPLASSYIQNVYAPDNDPNMVIEEFERTFEQNESLGLNDIKTD
ncbi:zinc-finger protein ZPR1 [Spathaspora passalidarum NRRL Y-27907]|uniref:Zinc-finger protein ZPR1 n=1 Tax=Spathaspora passalidarum (strain NRRL Y-27907 / 11-Y1) TaxID=619300 RepID=G3ADZ3_SPAPN|nr:zinc-finger protein ZPR1 [Spathaspora passalidarum NRRL Y-27907]EGW34717.1 zinc-finger protein ZPR1 [Spathaspora passalidarum NRRL Y-27907]